MRVCPSGIRQRVTSWNGGSTSTSFTQFVFGADLLPLGTILRSDNNAGDVYRIAESVTHYDLEASASGPHFGQILRRALNSADAGGQDYEGVVHF